MVVQGMKPNNILIVEDNIDLWFTEYYADNTRFSIKINKPVISLKSEYQRIDVFDT